MNAAPSVDDSRAWAPADETHRYDIFHHTGDQYTQAIDMMLSVLCYSIIDAEGLSVYLSFIHLTVGGGSPTALHGRIMSRIHGVVTVPLKVRILAGAAQHEPHQYNKQLTIKSIIKG